MTVASINRRAAAAIARHATSPAECRVLLDMLGLLDADGSLAPDDTKDYGTFVDPSVGPGATNPDPSSPRAFVDHGRRPQRMTTPAGLAHLTPVAEQPVSKPSKPKPAVIKQPKPAAPIPECGEYRAYARHRRLGEPIDDACYQASLAYGRMANSAYRARKRVERETKRLIAAGVNPQMAAVLAAGKRPPHEEAS